MVLNVVKWTELGSYSMGIRYVFPIDIPFTPHIFKESFAISDSYLEKFPESYETILAFSYGLI